MGVYLFLNGGNVGRWLYSAGIPLRLVYAVVQVSYKWAVLPSVITYVIIAYFLFRPDANAFFAAGGANAALQPRTTARRMFSTALYCLAGAMIVMARRL